ncbi:hypothetical protein GJ496_001654 [Pomphorhynchus laevis]|nr:hypothetical protein GJ496_001654 [Pomphorhynchus laevis]
MDQENRRALCLVRLQAKIDFDVNWPNNYIRTIPDVSSCQLALFYYQEKRLKRLVYIEQNQIKINSIISTRTSNLIDFGNNIANALISIAGDYKYIRIFFLCRKDLKKFRKAFSFEFDQSSYSLYENSTCSGRTSKYQNFQHSQPMYNNLQMIQSENQFLRSAIETSSNRISKLEDELKDMKLRLNMVNDKRKLSSD